MSQTDTKTTHTPGPWEAERAEADGILVSSDTQDIVATLYDDHYAPEATAIQEANGRLIAAAPELLKALENLVPFLGYDPFDNDDFADAKKAAKQAIRKAEGV